MTVREILLDEFYLKDDSIVDNFDRLQSLSLRNISTTLYTDRMLGTFGSAVKNFFFDCIAGKVSLLKRDYLH